MAAGGNKYPLWATLIAGGFHCLLEGAMNLDPLQLVPLPRPCVHAGRVLGLWTRILASAVSTLLPALPVLPQVTQAAYFVHCSALAFSSWWPTLPSRYASTPCLT